MFRCYIFFICLLQLAIIVNSLIGRTSHTACYVDNKIYFIGGTIEKGLVTNDVFYLDVSKPFSLLGSDLPIVNITSNISNIKSAMSTVCKDTIFLLGGYDVITPFIYAYNTSAPGWLPVNDGGTRPMGRTLATAECDKNSNIYFFGGSTAGGRGNTNDFGIFDTNQSIWSVGNNFNIPPAMDTFASVLLTDGRIVYIGGVTWPESGSGSNPKFIGMSEIYIYDTNNNEWSMQRTNGDSFEPRVGHTAVLTQDGRIIVYGGVIENWHPVSDPLLVLDTTTQPFNWFKPDIVYEPSFRLAWKYTATLVGNYMFVAFGFNNFSERSDKIYLLDVNSYEWVTKFTPAMSTIDTSNTPVLSQSPSLITLGIIIGGTIGGIVLSIVAFLLYHKNFRDQEVLKLCKYHHIDYF